MTDLQKARVEKLCAALESGKYLPGQLRLRQHVLPDGENAPAVNPDGPKDLWCCLGVACEIYRLETGNGEWKDVATETGLKKQKMRFVAAEDQVTTEEGQASTAYLPREVYEWYGFGYENPSLLESTAAEENDRRPITERRRAEIADGFRERYLA